MKVVIFAGGVGTRLWPLSRKNTPKQFEKIIGNKSTLQETIDRLLPMLPPSDIYVATGKRYESIIKKQLPQIPPENLIFEPHMRDVGPAIGLVAAILDKKISGEPIAILWSDHLVKNVSAFTQILRLAEEAIKNKKADFVFLGQKPRFANQNMGWIEVGVGMQEENGIFVYPMKRVVYRPKLKEAISFFESGHFVWNLGYFVTTPRYLCSLYEKFSPSMHKTISEIVKSYETKDFDAILETLYPRIEKISFDDAVLVKMKPDNILVISADLGWSDIGAWESLKEALSETTDENVTKGKVLLEASRDSLVFNYTDQLVVGIDLEQMLVIQTGDVVLVCPKKAVPKIKKLVENLAGTPNEHLA